MTTINGGVSNILLSYGNVYLNFDLFMVVEIDDEYYMEDPYNPQPQLSYSIIANHMAQCATLSISLSTTIYSTIDKETLIDPRDQIHILASAAGLASVFFELAKRGILVQRELLEIDDVDLGWLISEANLAVSEWQRGGARMLGSIFLLTPVILSGSFQFSYLQNLHDKIDLHKVQETITEFLENTTPEDAVNVINMLYTLKIEEDPFSISIDIALPETIEDVLDTETTLYDFFQLNTSRSYVYKEIVANYKVCFQEGWLAFLEAWNETHDFSISIKQTFLTLLAVIEDNHLINSLSWEKARAIQTEALEAVEEGGLLTEKGRQAYAKLIKNNLFFEKSRFPATTIEMTTVVIFLALLMGYRP